MSNFISDCISGDALSFEIDDYIDSWHEGDTSIPIHEYLGMTKSEYALYVEDESYIPLIITAHKERTSVKYLVQNQLAMAARSDSSQKSKRLEKWLRNEGLWED